MQPLRRLPWMLALLALTALSGTSCSSFERVVDEFDTIAGITKTAPEPAALLYPDNVRRWARSLAPDSSRRVPPSAIESPSAYARARVVELVEKASGEVVPTALVTWRLLLVLERDVNALNRIEAIEGCADLLGALRIQLLPRLHPRRPDIVAKRTAAVCEALSNCEALVSAQPALSADPNATNLLLDACALAGTSGSLTEIADDRYALRVCARIAAAVQDDRAEFVHAALVEIIGNASARALWDSCRSSDPRLRRAATIAIYRLVGPKSLPILLRLLSRSNGARFRYPVTLDERRTLLRLASHASGSLLFERYLNTGPRIVDFIYDTIANAGPGTDRGNGLQVVALETLARCLGRPISLDRSWADDWWRELALRDGQP